jgi:hypothetical protein
MKFFSLLLIAASLSVPAIVVAQVHCPIRCDSESFPYWFCEATGGGQKVWCSTNPDSLPGWLATKTHMPGRVDVVPIDTSLWYQPDGPVPNFTATPPNRQTIFDNYASTSYGPPPSMYSPYEDNTDFWGDSEAYAVGWAQWDLDSAVFLAGDTQEYTYYDHTDYDQESAFDNYVAHDYQELWEIYDEEESTWEYDSTRHYTGNDVSYTQIFSSGGASSDALGGLIAWLAVCRLSGDLSCPIYIYPDFNPQNWKGNYQATPGHPLSFQVGYTAGMGTYCVDGRSCADSSLRYIIYNATNSFFYLNNTDAIIANTAYILHPYAPLMGWFNGGSDFDADVDTNYSSVTFKQMVEHEEGHFLDMNHPERLTSDSASCVNNQTACPAGGNPPMLMSVTPIHINFPPEDLQPDDKCMFQKLYCPGTGYDGVQEVQIPEPPSPEIFPNPTTGACQLQYVVADGGLVQIAIYDALGKELRSVFSGYGQSGQQSISLGTESLPSGSYVCRVRVGDRVSYINLAITK